MSTQDDRDFQQWTKEWQAGTPRDVTTRGADPPLREAAQRLVVVVHGQRFRDRRHRVTDPGLFQRGREERSGAAEHDQPRLDRPSPPLALAGGTGAACCGRRPRAPRSTWPSPPNVLRRLRLAWRIGWVVLAGEVVVFVIWIWDHLYSGARPHDVGAERFAWGWLAGFTLVAIVSMVWFGRWITRDAERFEASAARTRVTRRRASSHRRQRARSPGASDTRKPRRPPLM